MPDPSTRLALAGGKQASRSRLATRSKWTSTARFSCRRDHARFHQAKRRPARLTTKHVPVVHPSSDRPWPLAIALPGGGALFPARCAVVGLENEMLVVEEGQVSPAWPADRRRPVALGRGGAQL